MRLLILSLLIACSDREPVYSPGTCFAYRGVYEVVGVDESSYTIIKHEGGYAVDVREIRHNKFENFVDRLDLYAESCHNFNLEGL